MPAGTRGENQSRMDWIMGIGNHDVPYHLIPPTRHFLFTTTPSHMLTREGIWKTEICSRSDEMMWELKEMLSAIKLC